MSIRDWLYNPASSNVRVLAWVLVMALALLLAARAVRWVAAHAPAFKDTMAFVAVAPTTNLRILIGIALAVLFVIGTIVANLFGIILDETILLYIGGFILIQEAVDVAQFGWKRSTFRSDAMGMTRESANPSPGSPASEIVATTGTAPVPAKVEPPKEVTIVNPPVKQDPPTISTADLPPGATVEGTGD
jgi:hypothetical protein